MIVVLLDTNIYNRILTQGQPGCEIEYFEQLKKLAAESKIAVVVPEVVLLEFEKFYRQVSAEYAKRLAQLESAVKDAFAKKEIWNELDDVKKGILDLLENTGKEKPKSFTDRLATVNGWLRSNAVKFVPFTIEVMWKAKVRLLAGRMPNAERTSDQDAAIIESILTVRGSDDELYFCSADTGDFAVPLDSGKFALHPILREALPRTAFFPDLKTMVEAIAGGAEIPAPSEQELDDAVRKCERKQEEEKRQLEGKLEGSPLYQYLRRTGWSFAQVCEEFSRVKLLDELGSRLESADPTMTWSSVASNDRATLLSLANWIRHYLQLPPLPRPHDFE